MGATLLEERRGSSSARWREPKVWHGPLTLRAQWVVGQFLLGLASDGQSCGTTLHNNAICHHGVLGCVVSASEAPEVVG